MTFYRAVRRCRRCPRCWRSAPTSASPTSSERPRVDEDRQGRLLFSRSAILATSPTSSSGTRDPGEPEPGRLRTLGQVHLVDRQQRYRDKAPPSLRHDDDTPALIPYHIMLILNGIRCRSSTKSRRRQSTALPVEWHDPGANAYERIMASLRLTRGAERANDILVDRGVVDNRVSKCSPFFFITHV